MECHGKCLSTLDRGVLQIGESPRRLSRQQPAQDEAASALLADKRGVSTGLLRNGDLSLSLARPALHHCDDRECRRDREPDRDRRSSRRCTVIARRRLVDINSAWSGAGEGCFPALPESQASARTRSRPRRSRPVSCDAAFHSRPRTSSRVCSRVQSRSIFSAESILVARHRWRPRRDRSTESPSTGRAGRLLASPAAALGRASCSTDRRARSPACIRRTQRSPA